ncbi:MAG: helix-turn-helix domain-containing protein [Elusimicrobia bacterium]|nr:helix-turn-helix domain-containing protein [Elusimicrobiota bacterium]
MPDIGKLLKEEIKRLALRSARPLHRNLKKDVAQLKHAVAALKKENARLAKTCAALAGNMRGTLARPAALPEKKLEQLRIGPKLILAQRKRLDLSRADFAKLLGVSAGAVVSWESGKVRPRENVKGALAAIRGMGKRQARQRLEVLSGN